MSRIAVIGAGAAGCLCAAELRRLLPEASVDVFEAGPRPLAKVAITGGGRCNLTNSFEGIRSLSEAYPRGERLMKRLLKVFSQEDAWRWFERAGVPLVLQEDHCVFPRSQDAMDIVHALLRAMDGARFLLRTPVHSLTYSVSTGGTGHPLVDGDAYDAVVILGWGDSDGFFDFFFAFDWWAWRFDTLHYVLDGFGAFDFVGHFLFGMRLVVFCDLGGRNESLVID